jgi:hypothetical protein
MKSGQICNECAGNVYPSKYSKYDEELPNDIRRLYSSWSAVWAMVLSSKNNLNAENTFVDLTE